jgi:hypothetical protein
MIGRAVTETMKTREREKEKIGDRGCGSDGETASEAREITLLLRDCPGLGALDAKVTSSMLIIDIPSLNVWP